MDPGSFWQLLIGCHSLANNAFRGLTLKSFHMHGAGSLHRHDKGCCKRHAAVWSDWKLHTRVYIAYNFMCDGQRGRQTPLLESLRSALLSHLETFKFCFFPHIPHFFLFYFSPSPQHVPHLFGAYFDLAGLELKDQPAFATCVLGLKVHATTLGFHHPLLSLHLIPRQLESP